MTAAPATAVVEIGSIAWVGRKMRDRMSKNDGFISAAVRIDSQMGSLKD